MGFYDGVKMLLTIPEHRAAYFSYIDIRARRTLPLSVRRSLFSGEYYCPVCDSRTSGFRHWGVTAATWCTICGAMNRHRFLWSFLSRQTDLFQSQGKRMLHIAPEMELKDKFSHIIGDGYLTADLLDSRAMIRMDITDIKFEDDSFDIIYCSHVLEHVPDDRKAMCELRRVLRQSGWALLMVPITVHNTVEDPSIMDPAERQRLFGQVDHVRRYGPDFEDRLRESGFDVKRVQSSEMMNQREIKEQGLTGLEMVFFCRK